MRSLLWMLPAALATSACGTTWVPLPAQRTEKPQVIRAVLDMTGGRPPNTWGTVDGGVSAAFQPGADWRWASEHGLFHFKLADPAGWKFVARITAVQAVLDKVGQQKITFQVNGSTVAAADLKVSRNYDFEVPLDSALLQQASPVTVTMDSGPCLPQQYGPPFCVLIHSIGFTKSDTP